MSTPSGGVSLQPAVAAIGLYNEALTRDTDDTNCNRRLVASHVSLWYNARMVGTGQWGGGAPPARPERSLS